ncbi:MAG: hypothetical protein M1817_002805 [Caeruleum heppii]|nr:MAG: hypothetical protein M1817_002805 [Caeruleum heppii]
MSTPTPSPLASQLANGAPTRKRRKPQTADPLIRPKPSRNRPSRPVPPKTAPDAALNGTAATTAARQQNKPATVQGKGATPAGTSGSLTSLASRTADHDVKSPPAGQYTDYPLVISKRALQQGLRFHVARFASKKNVDPTNDKDFTRPVRLHRRDPRAPPAGAGIAKNEDAQMVDADSKESLLDEKERERQEMIRAEKEAQKQADLAQIAPTASQQNNINKRASAFTKKTTQVYNHNQTPEAEKRSRVRYEESMPWHLEDFDNKNTWIGNYESALSESYVALVAKSDGCYHMKPLERWYRFTPKNQFKTLTIEEAESRMGQKVRDPRWFMNTQKGPVRNELEKTEGKAGKGIFLGKWESTPAGRSGITSRRAELADADDVDFEEDRFADDEENPIIEGEEEETKRAEDRIKKDQLQANIFGLREEKEYEQEDAEEKKETELSKKLGKGVKKALKKREKNFIYESDSDENPYSEKSESEDTDEEKRKEEERKKAEEKSDKAKNRDGNKLPSGASSRGSNTPSGRTKHIDPTKKAGSTLKRPGSPDLSEASATDSRKKPKNKHNVSSSQRTATSTPVPASRPMSPGPPSSAPEATKPLAAPQPQRKSSIVRLSVEPGKLNELSTSASAKHGKRSRFGGAASGSDAEATGTDMSDGGQQRKKIKLRMNPPSVGGTPEGSRSGSPNPTQRTSGSVGNAGRPGSPPGASPTAPQGTGSRAGSPTARASPAPKEISEEEIIAAIPAEGTSITALITLFGRPRVMLDQKSFIRKVKKHADWGSDKKIIRRKGAVEGAASK